MQFLGIRLFSKGTFHQANPHTPYHFFSDVQVIVTLCMHLPNDPTKIGIESAKNPFDMLDALEGLG